MRRLLISFAALVLSTTHAASQAAERVHPDAKALLKQRPAEPKIYHGPSSAVIFDLQAGGRPTSVTLQGDDPHIPDAGAWPANDPVFHVPVFPGDLSFARVELNGGAALCSSAVIGSRYLITAGHCVFDGGSF